MKNLLLFLVVIAFVSPVFAQDVKVVFDKFQNKTFVATDTRDLGFLSVRLYAVYPGDTLTESVQHIAVSFSSISRDWRFLRSNNLIFLIDGEPLKVGRAVHDGKIGNRGTVAERLNYQITVDEAKRIATAQVVEFQIGTFEGRLSDKDRRVFRAIVDAVTVPK